MIMIRTVPNVMKHYRCSAESAQRYVDLRDEGYDTFQAALMAGLTDPPDPYDAPVPTQSQPMAGFAPVATQSQRRPNLAKSKSVSLYLTDRSIKALRPGEPLSARVNQVLDRYQTILEVSREAARAYFDDDQWTLLRAADAKRMRSVDALADLHLMVAELGTTELAIAMENLPVWQALMVLELIEEDASIPQAGST